MKLPFARFLARRRQATPPKPLEEPHCPFPNCGVVFIPVKGKPDVCPEHRKLIADVTFILAHLKTAPVPPTAGPKIIVPGGPVVPPRHIDPKL